jgi:hypothetical protein
MIRLASLVMFMCLAVLIGCKEVNSTTRTPANPAEPGYSTQGTDPPAPTSKEFEPVFVPDADKDPEKKDDGPKFDLSYLEKTWGIKFKSQSVTEIEMSKVFLNEIKILLEFTKDVENLKELRQAFTPPPMPLKADTIVPLWFIFFDEDNVSLGRALRWNTEGEISGKKGDAFRVVLFFDSAKFKKTRKIEARAGEKPEKEGK